MVQPPATLLDCWLLHGAGPGQVLVRFSGSALVLLHGPGPGQVLIRSSGSALGLLHGPGPGQVLRQRSGAPGAQAQA